MAPDNAAGVSLEGFVTLYAATIAQGVWIVQHLESRPTFKLRSPAEPGGSTNQPH